MELGIRVTAEASVEREGTVVLPGRLLLDVVRSLPKDDLSLEYRSSEGDVEVVDVNGRARYRFINPPDGVPETVYLDLRFKVKGSDLVTRVPKTITINEDEMRDALRDCVGTIVETVRVCLERTPPEIAADMVDNGIVLTGGGALLTGLDEVIRKETYLPVTIAPNPLLCVALGVGSLLDDIDLLERVALES